MLIIGPTARRIAAGCCNYILTRFPPGHDVPVCVIDQEWFADLAEKEIRAGQEAANAEPVTADWLLSLPGAGRPDETGPRIRVPAPGGRALDLFPWKGGWAVEAREQHPGGDYAGRVSLPDVHTRGHVRRLLAALGVTPGESR